MRERMLIKQSVETSAREEGVQISRVLLFGSRARGSDDEGSDWDILVVVRDPLERRKRRDLYIRLNQHLADVRIPADVVIRTESEVGQALGRIHSIVKTAIQEGVIL